MTDIDSHTLTPLPRESLVTLTHLIYGLHAFSAVMGLLGSAFIVTAFLTGWPSIIAVILNYVKRNDVRGTYLDSHFSWQIRTFWFAALWVVIAWGVVIGTIGLGIVIAWPLAIAVGLWVLYRIIRGWLTLNQGKPMPV
jgi:uncharacterized membrane protein